MKTLKDILREVAIEKNRELEPKKVDNYNVLTVEEKIQADENFKISNDNYQRTLSNSMKDSEKNLKKILRGLNSDLDRHKKGKKYEIPDKLAELFKIFLMENGKRGGFISKIRNEDFDKITEDEKLNFLDGAMKKIEISNVWSKEEVREVREKFTNDVYYNKIVDKIFNKIIDNVKKKMNYEYEQKIKSEIKCGILRPTEKIEKVEFDSKEIKKGSSLVHLDARDRVALLRYMEVVMDEAIVKWRNMGELADEIKAEKIEKVEFNLEEFKKGSSLVYLDARDRVGLLRYMEVVMDEAIVKWRSIGELADEIKAVEIDEFMDVEDEEEINKGIESIIYGSELLNESISDYEKYRKKREPIDKESLEEAEKYLEELEDLKLKNKFKGIYFH